ncbi:MAG TPA: hypothetical protein VHM23_03535 [Actinomycetota bacterium]|nr:hypothetical protein [Actinomycetota bacterium]
MPSGECGEPRLRRRDLPGPIVAEALFEETIGMVICGFTGCLVCAAFYWKPEDGRRQRRYSCARHVDQLDPGGGWIRHEFILPFTA